MGHCLFDRKLGAQFISTVPASPGVYLALDASGTVIYVGKAKNLRRRLQQYRNARRRKKHLKMRAILRDAVSLSFEACASELEALLRENALIRELRPRLNVAGAFSFLYPAIGLKREKLDLHLCYTTDPGALPGFTWHGVFRSRQITREAYFALIAVMSFIGHREPRRRVEEIYPSRPPFGHIAAFRQVRDGWARELEAFFRGQGEALLENAVLALVENAQARKAREEIQEHFDSLSRFYRFEAKPLRRALASVGPADAAFIPQAERDALFLRARYAKPFDANRAAKHLAQGIHLSLDTKISEP
jgi:excinuclease ABC subunit C